MSYVSIENRFLSGVKGFKRKKCVSHTHCMHACYVQWLAVLKGQEKPKQKRLGDCHLVGYVLEDETSLIRVLTYTKLYFRTRN